MGTLLQLLAGRLDGSQLPASLGGTPPKGGPSRQVYGGTWSGRRITMDHDAKDWAAMPTAFRCVQAIAQNAASVDLTVLVGDEPNDQHPVAQLWNRTPNPQWSARALKEVTFARLQLLGEHLMYLDRGPDGTGPIAAMWPLFDPVEVLAQGRADGSGELEGYLVRPRNGNPVPLLPSEVLWLRFPDPFDRWGALAPWKAALFEAESDAYARAWQRSEFQNGARPSHVVYLGDLEDEAGKAAAAEYRAQVEGPGNAGKSLLMWGEQRADATRLGLTPAEMSYLESRAANAEHVMLAFGVPRDYLMGGTTWENRTAAKRTLWSDKITNDLEVLASETDRQLLPDPGEEAAFDLSRVDALQDNADALWTRVNGSTGSDLLLLDEARAAIGYDPLPNGLGQQTLSAYRAAVSAQSGPAIGRALLPPPRVRILVTARGRRELVTRAAPIVTEARHKLMSRPRVVAFYDRHEAVGRKVMQRLAAKQERVVLRRLRELMGRMDRDPQAAQRLREQADQVTIGRSEWTALPVVDVAVRIAGSDLLDPEYWRQQTEEATQAWLHGVWEGGALEVADGLGLDFTLLDPKVMLATANRAQVLAELVTATTRQVLDAQLLLHGIEEGESIDQLAERIRAVFADLSTYRAERIARTETVGGFNAASRIAAKESGVVTGRTWLATKDERTREDHVAVNGEHVDGMDRRYTNGLLHPGEPGAPAHQVINCRCVELYDVEG